MDVIDTISRTKERCKLQMSNVHSKIDFFLHILVKKINTLTVCGLPYEYNVMIKAVIAGGGVTTIPER